MSRRASGFFALCLAACLCTAPGVASAQGIGFAQAIDLLATRCSKDIEKFCKTVNLGGGRMMQCLQRNAGAVSSQCKASTTQVIAMLSTRAEARKRIPQVCDADVRRLCPGIQQGDGNLMECFYKAKQNFSAPCKQAVADAGYE